ncbi:MAG: nucleotide-binding protein [Christensenellales bacterium]
MKIAVLSGKGGTGKTLVSVNLAAAAQSVYIDCDVEEPNGHLFFKPEGLQKEEISVRIPKVNKDLCNGCRKCVDFCKFNALAYVQNNLLVFDDVCHSCGGCVLLCAQKALSEQEKVIGYIQKGSSDNAIVYSGVLNTGEASGIPIIRKLMERNRNESCLTFVDCPPGSACIVMECIKNADYCIFVTEPTLFGVHNTAMVYELVKIFGKPYGAILNKCLGTENLAEEFCQKNDMKVLGRIPYDKDLGLINSNAQIAARVSEEYNAMFMNLLQSVLREALYETIVNS